MKEIETWYRNHLIKAHGEQCMSLIHLVISLTPYEEMKAMFAKETGTEVGPYTIY